MTSGSASTAPVATSYSRHPAPEPRAGAATAAWRPLLEVDVDDVLHEPVDAELQVVSFRLQHHKLAVRVQLLQSQVVLRQ